MNWKFWIKKNYLRPQIKANDLNACKYLIPIPIINMTFERLLKIRRPVIKRKTKE